MQVRPDRAAPARGAAAARLSWRRPRWPSSQGSARIRANVRPAVGSQRRAPRARGERRSARAPGTRARAPAPDRAVGLRTAGDPGVQEQRVESDVAGPRAPHAYGARAGWATSSGTSSRATGATSRGTSPGTRLLDVGCGGAWLADHFADYTGVDGSPEAVAAAAARAPACCSRTSTSRSRSRTSVRRRGAQGPARARGRPGRARARGPARRRARAAACSPPPRTRSAGSGTTTRTGGRSPARASGCCSPTRACDVEQVGYESVMPGTSSSPGAPARTGDHACWGRRAPADGAAQRLACGQSLSRQALERFATIEEPSACRGLRIDA